MQQLLLTCMYYINIHLGCTQTSVCACMFNDTGGGVKGLPALRLNVPSNSTQRNASGPVLVFFYHHWASATTCSRQGRKHSDEKQLSACRSAWNWNEQAAEKYHEEKKPLRKALPPTPPPPPLSSLVQYLQLYLCSFLLARWQHKRGSVPSRCRAGRSAATVCAGLKELVNKFVTNVCDTQCYFLKYILTCNACANDLLLVSLCWC